MLQGKTQNILKETPSRSLSAQAFIEPGNMVDQRVSLLQKFLCMYKCQINFNLKLRKTVSWTVKSLAVALAHPYSTAA